MIIVAWTAIGICIFIALMLSLMFVIGCNGYDDRIRQLENWQREARNTFAAYDKELREKKTSQENKK
jgi:hypothetical protein